MRAVNIIGIVGAVGLFIFTGYYAMETSRARYSYMFSDDWSLGYARAADITMEAATIAFVFTLFYTFAAIFNLVKVKTTTTKVLAIILISLQAILILVNLTMLAEPSSVSWDEGGGFFILYALIYLAFFIVFLVQVSVAERKTKTPVVESQVLDDEIV